MAIVRARSAFALERLDCSACTRYVDDEIVVVPMVDDDEFGAVRPAQGLSEVRWRVGGRRRRARTGRVALAVGAGLAVVVLTGTGTDDTPVDRPPVAVDMESLGGLMIIGAGTDLFDRRTTIERVDSFASSGPYAVVVRRVDGRLGAASAVITHPAPDGVRVDGEVHVASSSGTLLSALVIVRPGGTIVVRASTLTADQVMALAAATSVVDGRPVVSLPASMRNYAVVASATARPPVIRSARYGCEALGEGTTLGGLCYTGLATSPGFEDALYARGYEPGPLVRGQPSVASGVGGGSTTLAWEPRPGVVAFVAYSGPAGPGPKQVEALARLAERSSLLSPAEWAATGAQTGDQTNDWS